jgi:hypothetical protein
VTDPSYTEHDSETNGSEPEATSLQAVSTAKHLFTDLAFLPISAVGSAKMLMPILILRMINPRSLAPRNGERTMGKLRLPAEPTPSFNPESAQFSRY